MIYNSKIDMHTCTLLNYIIAAHDHTYMTGVNKINFIVCFRCGAQSSSSVTSCQVTNSARIREM